MNALVVGLGSMGKRRIRILQKQHPEIGLCGVDSSAGRRKEAEKLFSIHSFSAISEAVQAFHPEIGFVCTSPASHYTLIEEILKYGMDVFTEINLVNKDYSHLEKLAVSQGRLIFVSATPLYRREVRRIQELVSKTTQPLSYSLHIGQYLPDWHPWEKIEDFFVSCPETNGCREIFAIQLPWLLKTFGPLASESPYALKQKITDLPLRFPDCYHVLLQHEAGHCGTLQVDIVARRPVSEFMVIGQELQIRWDGTPKGLYCLDMDKKEYVNQELYQTFEQNESYAANIIEDAYMEETECFLKSRTGEAVPLYSLAEDSGILSLIDRIEQ